MDKDEYIHYSSCMLLVIIAILISSIVSILSTKAIMRKQAIENNVAYYHPQTGEFTWNKVENPPVENLIKE